MEELKCCLFCGRYIDTTFRYCPYCGYEFSAREDFSDMAEEMPGDVASSFLPAESDCLGAERGILPFDQHRAKSDSPERADPPLTCIARLRNMEKLLADMERELDLIISRAQKPVTSSSKGL
jgi:hypothetical protein